MAASNPTVTIVDYGLGNLLSVVRAFEYCGAKTLITDSPAKITEATHLVIPGVGAFADGMAGLERKSLIEPIRRFAANRRPLLGICLGMQMLLESAEEFGVCQGLGLIAGHVALIPNTTAEGTPHKIPHIGWNHLQLPNGTPNDFWHDTILTDLTPSVDEVYFVHSFTAIPTHNSARLADCYYHGRLTSAAIQAGSVMGCQFHPEKSGPVGLKIIRQFLCWDF